MEEIKKEQLEGKTSCSSNDLKYLRELAEKETISHFASSNHKHE